jgi:multidrug efflux pump subunit AcrB
MNERGHPSPDPTTTLGECSPEIAPLHCNFVTRFGFTLLLNQAEHPHHCATAHFPALVNLVRTSLRRPFTAIVLIAALLMASFFALRQMSRDIFPPLGIPTIYVAQPYGGMDPAQMEGYLTYYYEYHFLYITGIEHVESKSIQGASLMKLQFHPGTEMSAALSETVAYVNRARAFMPPGTPGAFVTRFDAGSVPVGHLVFSTDNPQRTVAQMQDAALNQVRPLFATLPGVSAPPPFGGSARTIVVNLKPDRLKALGIPPDEIVNAIAQANLVSPSGNINLGEKYPMVPVNAVPKNIKDLEGVPLRVGAGGAVFVRDVASVDDQADIVTSFGLVNGRRTVYIPVTKRADASTLSVVDLVKSSLPKFQAAVPEDVHVTFEFDQSPIVLRAIHELFREGLLGAFLTGLMVLLFIRDLRTAIVVIANIPVALLSAVLALWLCGQSINLMTLGGLALAVGILVDEATVTVENLHTHLSRGASLARAALDATLETAGPRLLALLSVLAAFTPALFMTGAARALFAPLSMAVGFSMAASYVLSSTLVPVLCIWLLRNRPTSHSQPPPRTLSLLQETYVRLLRKAITLRHVLVPAVLLGALLLTWGASRFIGTEIFPKADTGQMAIRIKASTGTRVEVTEQIALRALDLIRLEAGPDNVAITMGLVGVHAANYPVNLIHLWNSGPEEAWLAVQLKAGAPPIAGLQEKLRATFARELPGIRLSFEPSDIVSRVMSFGSNTPIEVAVSGPDLATNREHAEKIFTKLQEIPALRDIQFAQALDFPTVGVEINRERAGLLGVKTSDVTRSLVTATASSRFTLANYWADPKTGVSYNLQVQIPQAKTASVDDLKNLPVATRDGSSIALRNVATLTPGTIPGQFDRYNMSRLVSITANIHGSDLGTVAAQVQKAISAAGVPPAKTSVSLRGQAPPLRELLDGFEKGFVVAVAVIFLLLSAYFQSVRLSLVVLSALPAVLLGIVLALLLTGTHLNIQSAIGSIMSVGVAVANAILLVTFADRALKTGASPVEAAMTGACSRLRPILMTSLAMLAGMLPMAVGLGAAGGQSAPLGRAVVGGLAAATAATLLVVPCAFALFAAKSRRSASLDPDDPESHVFSHSNSVPASS